MLESLKTLKLHVGLCKVARKLHFPRVHSATLYTPPAASPRGTLGNVVLRAAGRTTLVKEDGKCAASGRTGTGQGLCTLPIWCMWSEKSPGLLYLAEQGANRVHALASYLEVPDGKVPTAGGRARSRPTLAATARGGSAQRPSAEVSFSAFPSEQLQLAKGGDACMTSVGRNPGNPRG